MTIARKRGPRAGGIHLLHLLRDNTPEARRRFNEGLRSALTDPTLSSEQRAELERYLANPMRAAADELQAFLNERAAFRGQGRTGGTDRARTERLRKGLKELRALHPDATAKKLRREATKRKWVPKNMSDERFANLVAEAAPRKPRKSQ